MKKIKILKAKQPSNVAKVTLIQGWRSAHWRYYTSSFGGTQWDERQFKSKDACISAAIKAGFKVKVETNG